MIRLHITAEGQTEQAFAEKILLPHLALFDVFVDARCVLTSSDKRTAKEFRGGLSSYEKAKRDIQGWLTEDNHTECRFSTMFDLYALPSDFPGYDTAQKNQNPYERVKIIETAMTLDINDQRFISYIQLHEFEALILADPQKLTLEYMDHDAQINNLIAMVGEQNPESINDGPMTAPSKRILKEIPIYDKATGGIKVAERIGLTTLRAKCKHFDDWVTRLEQLGAPA
ncbi:MAG: DUF4276 family protein [Candidatus Adiutrix sp.]|jgi:hypothetical protein|nr:DUF4276 family protein [Candidatus Adiutrix sp.]